MSWALTTLAGALLAAAPSLLAVACADGGCGGAGVAAGQDAGSDGRPDAVDGGDGGADGGCPDPTVGIAPGIPAGWVRAPCAPLDCEVYLAPSSDLARPASPWVSCGEGCLELAHDWSSDEQDRFFAPFGASTGTRDGPATRYIAYTRDLGAGQHEIQIVQLPDNRVAVDVIMPTQGLATARCSFYVVAMSSDRVVFELFVHTSETWINRRLVMAGLPDSAVPDLLMDTTDSALQPLESAATAQLWAMSHGRFDLLWHSLEHATKPEQAWSSPDGRYLYALSAVGSTVFFSTQIPGSFYQTEVWDSAGGVRTLLDFPQASLGGACCVQSDGVDMTWYQGSGWDAVAQTFQIELMASPFATDATKLEPREVRALAHDFLDASYLVGDGYALHMEQKRGDPIPYQHTLTRLSDGAWWVIPPRPGFHWGLPLYVDGDELALVENAGKDEFLDAGLKSGESYTIVRRTLASLGPPSPAN